MIVEPGRTGGASSSSAVTGAVSSTPGSPSAMAASRPIGSQPGGGSAVAAASEAGAADGPTTGPPPAGRNRHRPPAPSGWTMGAAPAVSIGRGRRIEAVDLVEQSVERRQHDAQRADLEELVDDAVHRTTTNSAA